MDSEQLVFNGIDGSSGDYLLPPLTPHEISALAQGEKLDPKHLAELRLKRDAAEAHFGVVSGDPTNLAEVGWGVVFAHDADPAVREALSPLLEHRRKQAEQAEAALPGVHGCPRLPARRIQAAVPRSPRRRAGTGGAGQGALLPADRRRSGADSVSLPVPTGRAIRRGANPLRDAGRVRAVCAAGGRGGDAVRPHPRPLSPEYRGEGSQRRPVLDEPCSSACGTRAIGPRN